MATDWHWWRSLREDLARSWPEPEQHSALAGHAWLLGIGFIAVFLGTMLWMHAGAEAGFTAINSAARWAPDGFWGLVTSAGDGLIVGVLGLFVARRYPHVLWIFFLGVLVAGVLTHVPKNIFDLPRPAAVLEPESFYLLGPALHTRGPPSGHALAIFMLAGVAIYFFRSVLLRLLALAVATLVALSRVVVGAHWPLDILLGAGFGLLGAWLVIRMAFWFPLGRHPGVHLAILGFFVAAAVVLLTFDPGYPLGRELSVVIAASTLFFVIRHYLWGTSTR